MKNEYKRELQKLIQEGIPFEITYQENRRKKGLLGYFQKKESVSVTRKFTIKEPTLHTLDRIALEIVDIDIHDLSTDLGAIKSKRYYKKLAKVIAIALELNDQTEEEKTAEILFKSLKPSSLKDVVTAMDITSNMADFTTSILSITAAKLQSEKTERIENQELSEEQVHTDDED